MNQKEKHDFFMHQRCKLLAKITADKTENMFILTFNKSFPFLSKTVTCQVLSTPWQRKVFSVRCKMDPVRIVKIIWIHMSVLQSLRGTRIIIIIISVFFKSWKKLFNFRCWQFFFYWNEMFLIWINFS